MKALTWVPYWTALNMWGKNRAVRSSYVWALVVPIAAKAASSFPDTVRLPWFNVEITRSLPFSWNLLYFSALCFAVASLTYLLQCPPIVRDFDHYAAFRDQGRQAASVIDELIDLFRWRFVSVKYKKEVIFPHIRTFAMSFTTQAVDEKLSAINLRGKVLELEITPNQLPNAFWFVRRLADESRLPARIICTGFFGLGSILLLVVFLQNMLYVIQAMRN